MIFFFLFFFLAYVTLSQVCLARSWAAAQSWACPGHPQDPLPPSWTPSGIIPPLPTPLLSHLPILSIIFSLIPIDFARFLPLLQPCCQPVRAEFARGKSPWCVHRAPAVGHSEVARKEQPVPGLAQDTPWTQGTSPCLFHQHLSPISTLPFLTAPG